MISTTQRIVFIFGNRFLSTCCYDFESTNIINFSGSASVLNISASSSHTSQQGALKDLLATSVEKPSGKGRWKPSGIGRWTTFRQRALKKIWQNASTPKNQVFNTIWPRNRRRKVENGWKFACANCVSFAMNGKVKLYKFFLPLLFL